MPADNVGFMPIVMAARVSSLHETGQEREKEGAMGRANVAVFSALVLSVAAFAAEGPLLSFDQVFPPAHQRQMGLHKLTNAEKEALRKHVEALLVVAARAGAERPVAPGEAPGRPAKPRGANVYAGVGRGHWVKENIGRGEIILLEDGSLWKIDPLEKLDASLWLKLSEISVLESNAGSPGYNYLLVNTDDGEKAHAKYMGKK